MATGNLKLIPRTDDHIHIGIAGMGKMGTYHLDALSQLAAGEHEAYYKGGISRELGRIRICGLCDSRPENLRPYADNVPCFENLSDLIEKTGPQILIIATPTGTHMELAKLALEHGLHVFVEKPLVTTRRDIDELCTLADANGCRLMSGHVERYNPVSMKIISLLQQVSPLPQGYSFTRTQQHHQRIQDNIVIDKVIHDLDLSLYFFGQISEVKVSNCRKVDGRVFEAKLEIRHESGICGNLFVSWLSEPGVKKRLIEIRQGGHTWSGDFVTKQLWVDGIEIRCEVDGMIKPANNQIKDELVDFLLYCLEPDPAYPAVKPLLSIEEIRQAITWIERINNEIELRA